MLVFVQIFIALAQHETCRDIVGMHVCIVGYVIRRKK